MKNPIAEKFYVAGQKLNATAGSQIVDALNHSLNDVLPSPFRAGPASMMDSQGQRSSTFGTLIRVTTKVSLASSVEVPAESAACAIDVSEVMDLERLRTAYARIAEAKTLNKPDRQGARETDVTLGIIFAADAAVPMEAIAEELDRLNRNTPSKRWTDMVVILSHGIINYGVQFPGEGVAGDFLPPAPGALSSYTPPVYVVMIIRPTTTHSFNKMCSYLVAHLMLFTHGAKLPAFDSILDGVPNTGITLSGYQYDLRGELVPVPRQFYNDRYLPPRPLRIEDDKGELLSTIRFLPWQDGGVILLTGKLPLEGLLVFLGEKARNQTGNIKRNGLQISNVLPITQADFLDLLNRIQRQSNMVVTQDKTKIVMQQFADEGTESPIMCRLFLGLLKLRDQALSEPAERLEFDNAFDFVLTEALNIRTTAQEIALAFQSHAQKVAKGEIARTHGHSIQIDESIDRQLGKQAEDFLNGAVRALKHGMQTLTKTLQSEIGFLFQKTAQFEKAVFELEKSDSQLATYLKHVRVWSERLQECRNAIEHKGWKLPKVKYTNDAGVIRTEEPEISGQKVTEFVKFMLDRILCFVEEVTTHCLQSKLPIGTTITELPLTERRPEAPLRFQVTLTSGGMSIWRIQYHHSSFEET